MCWIDRSISLGAAKHWEWQYFTALWGNCNTRESALEADEALMWTTPKKACTASAKTRIVPCISYPSALWREDAFSVFSRNRSDLGYCTHCGRAESWVTTRIVMPACAVAYSQSRATKKIGTETGSDVVPRRCTSMREPVRIAP